jgi:pyruvate dehydrogenase E2 component (dihydrolipoamide acetyltransferase)
MEHGTVLQWLVKPGDTIKRGDIVAVVDTEKATIEVEVFLTGTVQKIVVGEGEKVPVGTVMAIIATDGEVAVSAEPKPAPAPAPRVSAPPPRAIERPPPAKPPAAPPHHLRISPLAMRVAIELNIDPSTIAGTGPGGAITKSDVERAASAAPAPPRAAPLPSREPGEVARPAAVARTAMAPQERQAAMRKAIASAMARSKREIPHYYLGTHIDMERSIAWLRENNLKRTVTERMLYSVLLIKAVALATRRFPEINGFWKDGSFVPSADIHVGVAVSLRQGGLIAPAIHDTDKKSLDEVMANLRDVVNRVRAGVLRSSEIADATITVTSLGDNGVESVYGVIYPPQVALVGFGKIVDRPWAENEMIGVKPIVAATLAADHRASDGHRGGLFLSAIDRLLQEPEKL